MIRKKVLAILCTAIFTSVNTSMAVMAVPSVTTRVEMNEGLQKLNAQSKVEKSDFKEVSESILGMRKKKSDEFIYAKNLNEKSVKSILPTRPQMAKSGEILGSRAIAQQSYTLAQLKSMSYADMMDAIANTKWSNISDLFKNTAESRAFYNDTARFKYIISDLGNRASSFTSTDDKGIPTIVEVIRSGYFLGYYNPNDFPGLWNKQMAELCLPVLMNMLYNPYFNFGTETQNNVIEAFGSLIGNSTCDANIVSLATRLLTEFRVNVNSYITDLSKSNAAFKLISGIGYVYYTEAHDNWGKDPKTFPSYGRIDGFIDELIEISNIKGLSQDNQWLVNNATYYMGELGKFHSNQAKILQILTYRMDTATRYSADFFAAASQIHQSYNDTNARGENINYEKLQEEGNNYWLPNKYTFDDGAIVIHAGNKVSPEKIQRMYWATKEVESQFFRMFGNDKALEPNNADKVLTIKLFNSPAEYKMNSYLNGIETDNGGMYVEPYGTFYTYERTKKDSVYSLEELFRHEFTHYLQGKYQVPGLWGQGDFYSQNELEWFDEATAEFFAGSTRTEGVKPRKAIIGYLSSDPAKRFTLDRLFKSGYASGWDFYNYGFAYASYMYNYDVDTFMKINDAIMKYDINEFRRVLKNVASNPNTESAYQKYMDDLIADTSIGTPLVSDSYVQSHSKRSLAEIKSDISSVSGISNLAESKTTSGSFSTFKLSGKYVGTTSKGRVTDWKEMNAKANEMLKELSKKGWTGYETVTCYFTDYKVVNGIYEYNIVFRGLLNGDGSIVNPENQAPTVMIEAPSSVKVNETVNFRGDRSSDADGSIVSYVWNFGDNTENSNLTNPTHVYANEGRYNVSLKVTDDKGAVSEKSFTITVTKDEVVTPGGGLIKEVEKNDSVLDADKNGFIGNNTELKAVIENGSDMDIFAFEVDKPGKVDIKLTGGNANLTWVVYKATNQGEYVCWSQYTEGDSTIGSFDATKGKYYIQVYPSSHNVYNQNYSILINGIKSYTDNQQVPPTMDYIKEEEPNDTINSANVAIYNNIDTIGVLEAGDADIFKFDVVTTGKVDIKVLSNGKQYTWVVFKADNENNFVCWSQYSESYGTRGEFTATPGKYFIKLYSLNSQKVDYTVRISGIR